VQAEQRDRERERERAGGGRESAWDRSQGSRKRVRDMYSLCFVPYLQSAFGLKDLSGALGGD
jgi:hypothetical protein